MSGKKKPRIGRPPIPKKLHKDSLLSVRFSGDERKALEAAADGESLSAWARRVLLSEARASSAHVPHPAPATGSPSAPPSLDS